LLKVKLRGFAHADYSGLGLPANQSAGLQQSLALAMISVGNAVLANLIARHIPAIWKTRAIVAQFAVRGERQGPDL